MAQKHNKKEQNKIKVESEKKKKKNHGQYSHR